MKIKKCLNLNTVKSETNIYSIFLNQLFRANKEWKESWKLREEQYKLLSREKEDKIRRLTEEVEAIKIKHNDDIRMWKVYIFLFFSFKICILFFVFKIKNKIFITFFSIVHNVCLKKKEDYRLYLPI